ncbi:hypothetical protein C8J56DRAFT_899053 [Mycena floridula]|nr:hypothetical protein C8J56DRAFT_899053 [Mycena floridula]
MITYTSRQSFRRATGRGMPTHIPRSSLEARVLSAEIIDVVRGHGAGGDVGRGSLNISLSGPVPDSHAILLSGHLILLSGHLRKVRAPAVHMRHEIVDLERRQLRLRVGSMLGFPAPDTVFFHLIVVGRGTPITSSEPISEIAVTNYKGLVQRISKALFVGGTVDVYQALYKRSFVQWPFWRKIRTRTRAKSEQVASAKRKRQTDNPKQHFGRVIADPIIVITDPIILLFDPAFGRSFAKPCEIRRKALRNAEKSA